MSYEYKIGELKGDVRDDTFRVVRITARGRKTTLKADAEADEYSQPEVWMGACEEWLNLVGKQGWSLVSSENLDEYHVRYVLKRQTGGSGKGTAEKEGSITDDITKQVAGKAMKSVLKFP